jgi:hypothetical protein
MSTSPRIGEEFVNREAVHGKISSLPESRESQLIGECE